jgi:hypothetical protein
VFVVWQPMLPTDLMAPTTGVLRRMSDARASQYWDEQHVLARRMARDARPPQPAPNCCDHEGILWDLAAVYPRGARWDQLLPTARVFDGPVHMIPTKIESAIASVSNDLPSP